MITKKELRYNWVALLCMISFPIIMIPSVVLTLPMHLREFSAELPIYLIGVLVSVLIGRLFWFSQKEIEAKA